MSQVAQDLTNKQSQEPGLAGPPSTLMPTPKRKTKTLSQRVSHRLMLWIRRGHLFFGLFLFPWAILYGSTAFLFNHPSVLPDLPVYDFSRIHLADTPFASTPDLRAAATQVIEQLNNRLQPDSPFKLGDGEARLTGRDTMIAMVRSEKATFSIAFDPLTCSGSIRAMAADSLKDKPPFAVGEAGAASGGGRMRGMGGGGGGGMGPMRKQAEGLEVPGNLAKMFTESIPKLLERKGLPIGNINLTQAPELKFPIVQDGQYWTASYNPITTVVTGVPGTEKSELTIRSFLLRMHLSRGYPGALNTRWFWALGVDSMAILLCFWGVSGLFMWWQIKATRRVGIAILGLSSIAASALAYGMYSVLT